MTLKASNAHNNEVWLILYEEPPRSASAQGRGPYIISLFMLQWPYVLKGLYAKVWFSLNLALNHRKLEAFKTKEMFHGIRPLMFLLIGSGLRVSDTTWCPGPY